LVNHRPMKQEAVSMDEGPLPLPSIPSPDAKKVPSPRTLARKIGSKALSPRLEPISPPPPAPISAEKGGDKGSHTSVRLAPFPLALLHCLLHCLLLGTNLFSLFR
jgi:hypothetical protein